MNVLPVIIAGGSGARLWPLSRSGFPKQFLAFGGNETLFQRACLRSASIDGDKITSHTPVIVTNEEHRFLAAEQLSEIKINGTLLLEPVGRNTAPAMTLAALHAQTLGDPILFVTPADHTIQDDLAFQQAASKAIELANDGALVVLGITPDSAHTGYGYIKANLDDATVDHFAEKPDEPTAQQYLDDGSYFWNAGMLVVRASVWLNAIETFRDDIAKATNKAWSDHSVDGYFVRPNKVLFEQIPDESVDYAVIEKLPGSNTPIKMVPLDAGWNDLGSWDVVWHTTPTNSDGNALQGDVVCIDSTDSYVNASSRMVSLVGIDNVIVVETADAVLVADKARSQDVKKIVEQLKAERREESDLHRRVRRPWGWYDSLDEGDRFKVKRIQVAPGASLSLQKHYQRSEHWVVVKGTAEVTCGEKVLTLTENQSTYIPLGEVHRLANPGRTPLEIIEVQSGSYLGEDDIVRFEDKYGR
ncbi:mannose-1-phosphate guanylyltransferase/mannose-6-phosphate isomerase [Litoricola sp.]|nr:mannose-1-phosphate guanylyltransferase/mannose-6-phosphate isomerase [Litorivicinus sp.]